MGANQIVSHRNGHVHDGELEALAAVDRQDLHGGGVGLQAPGALFVGLPRRRRGSGRAASPSAPRSPGARRPRRGAGAGRRGAGRSCAVRRRSSPEHARPDRSDAVMASSSEATPRVRRTRDQPDRRRWTTTPRPRVASATRRAAHPGTGSERPAWAGGPGVGRSSACSRSCHVLGGTGLANTLPDRRRPREPREASAHRGRLRRPRCACAEHGDVTRPDAVACHGLPRPATCVPADRAVTTMAPSPHGPVARRLRPAGRATRASAWADDLRPATCP